MPTAYYTIDSSKIDANLTDFPVGIKIESSTGFMDGLGADDWENLHATVGGTECYVEVDVWDVDNDEAVIWVKVPTVSSSTDTVIKLTMGADNTATYVGETGDAAAQAVWDSDFVAVYHFSQDPTGGSGCILDSTANENNGTPAGSMTSGDLVDGGFGKALDFDGSDDVVDVTAIGSALSAWTISGVFKTDTITPERVLIANDLSGWNDDVLIGINPETGSGTGKFAANHQDATDDERTEAIAASITSIGNDYVFSVVADGSDLSLVMNDAATVTVAKEGTALDFGNNAIQIGFSSNGDRAWDGEISEIFLSSVARSDAWIKATYNVLADSLLFYSATDSEPREAYYTIDSSKIDAALTDFPVGIKVESSTGFMDGLGADDWENLHATVGETECYVEVDVWDPANGVAILWVKVPTVLSSVDTVIKIKMGADNTATYVGQTGDAAAQAVWDSDFVAVYHLSQEPITGSSTILDSTGNEENGTPYYTDAGNLVDGHFGKAIDFDGVQERIEIPNNLWETNESHTIEVFHSPDSTDTSDNTPLSADTDQFLLDYNDDDEIRVRYSSTDFINYPCTPSDDYGELVGWAVRYDTADDDNIELFVGGVSVADDSYNLGSYFPNPEIGARAGGGAFYDGTVEEVRVSQVARSDAWIKATYHVLNDSILFYSATAPTPPIAYYTIDSSKIDADLTDFPVGIKVESSTGFMDCLGADDWAYLHATVGETECYVEVDVWDIDNDEAVIWVKVPTVSSSADTVIKLTTGADNTATYVGQTGDAAAQAVWDSDFAAVYHCSQDPSATVKDSTANGNDLTDVGSMTSDDVVSVSSGLSPKGIDFDGSDDALECVDSTNYPESYPFTVEITGVTPAVVSSEVTGPGFYFVNDGSSSQQYNVDFSDGYPRFNRYISSASVFTHSTQIAAETFVGVAVVGVESDDLSIIVDGDDKESTSTGKALLDGLSTLSLGGPRDSSPSYKPGVMIEARLSTVARSDAWIKATYNVLADSLLTYSATEPAGDGATEPDIASQTIGLTETVGAEHEPAAVAEEPDIASQAIGFDESADGHLQTANRGVSGGVGIGASVGALVESVRGVSAGLGIGEAVSGEHVPASAPDEPEIGSQSLGIGEAVGREFSAERGLSVGVGLSVDAGVTRTLGPAIPEQGLGVDASAGAEKTMNRALVGAVGLSGVAGAMNYSAWVRVNRSRAILRYYARITGAADGLADHDLSAVFKSFQFRARSGQPTYLNLSLVYSASDMAAIVARSSGTLIVDMAAVINGAVSLREELVRADFHSARYDRGGMSQSITLIGYRTTTFPGRAVELSQVVKETMLADGRMQYRCAAPDFYLRPGDTATIGETSITVGTVTCLVSPGSQSMDVAEVEA